MKSKEIPGSAVRKNMILKGGRNRRLKPHDKPFYPEYKITIFFENGKSVTRTE